MPSKFSSLIFIDYIEQVSVPCIKLYLCFNTVSFMLAAFSTFIALCAGFLYLTYSDYTQKVT